ncbi:hypothetical protein ACFL4R_00185 [Nitrospirota bacterium]
MNKLVFYLSFAFMIIGCFVFGLLDKIPAMGLSIVAGAIGMAFSNLDKFRKIKGAGFEAELKFLESSYDTNITNELKRINDTLVLIDGASGFPKLKSNNQETDTNNSPEQGIK